MGNTVYVAKGDPPDLGDILKLRSADFANPTLPPEGKAHVELHQQQDLSSVCHHSHTI